MEEGEVIQFRNTEDLFEKVTVSKIRRVWERSKEESKQTNSSIRGKQICYF